MLEHIGVLLLMKVAKSRVQHLNIENQMKSKECPKYNNVTNTRHYSENPYSSLQVNNLHPLRNRFS